MLSASSCLYHPPLPLLLGQQLNVTRKDPGLVSPYHSLAKLSPVAGIVTLAPGRVRQEDESSRLYPWLQVQVEADLGYLKPCLNKAK